MGQCLLLLAALLCRPQPVSAADHTTRPWRVMILNSSHPSELVAQSFGRVIRQALTTRTAHPIDFFDEFLDSLRFPGASYDTELVTFLTRKYSGQRPDLVITVFPEALQFFATHRDELWPATPAVFVGVPDDLPGARSAGPGITGILTHVDFAGTIELALRLQPASNRVVVVSGASNFDRLWRDRSRAALDAYAGRLQTSYLDGLATPDLLRAVSALPERTIVLLTTVFRDAAGRPLVPEDVSRQLAAASSAPVYCMFEPVLGTGIVGGSIVHLDAQADRAGEIGLAILGGKTPESIAVELTTASVPTLDWRTMQRLGMSDTGLPAGSIFLFRSTSVWSQYRGRILFALALVFVQSGLIAALLIERRSRRRAELRAQRQSVELAHASRLATVGELTASIAHQVNQPLGAILSNADAAEMLLDARPLPLDELRQILADIRRDDERASEVIRGMRALLRRRDMHRQRVDLNDAIAEVVRLLDGESKRHGVTIDADLTPGLPAVEGDRVHLQQVVLNLALNGLEAAAGAAGDPRRVTIRTATSEGGQVAVMVSDTGSGIAADRMPRLFESFFTTKPNGMGLGLSIARSLVEAHGGRIWAENHPGGGAAFRFTLPACADAPRPEPAVAAAAPALATDAALE